jgi:hypothetical protein
MSESDFVMHLGGCHCGRIRFEVLAAADIHVSHCNCSICSMTGYQHLIVPAERFRLAQGEQHLTTYQFNSGVAKHHFCSHCGIKSFYVPRSHPDGVSVNVRCLDPGTVNSVHNSEFEGADWENNIGALNHFRN